jgi:hypothetical protein
MSVINEAAATLSFMEEQRKQGQEGMKLLEQRLAKMRSKAAHRRTKCRDEPANSKEVFFGSHERKFKSGEHEEHDYRMKLAAKHAEILREKTARATRMALVSGNIDLDADQSERRRKKGKLSAADRLHGKFEHIIHPQKAKKGEEEDKEQHKNKLQVGIQQSLTISEILHRNREAKRVKKQADYSKMQLKQKFVRPWDVQDDGVIPGRKLEDLETFDLDAPKPFDLEIEDVTQEVLRTMQLRVSLTVGKLFQKAMHGSHCQQIMELLFWFSFCKQFKFSTADTQDELVVEMSSVYAEFMTVMTAFSIDSEADVNQLKKHRTSRDIFFRYFPFIMSEAVYLLLRFHFPGSRHVMSVDLRDRLDTDFLLLLSGAQFSQATMNNERAKLFPPIVECSERKDVDDDSDSDDLESFLQSAREKKDRKERAAYQDEEWDPLHSPTKRTPFEASMRLTMLNKEKRKANLRVRPRQVRFNTNLITPVLQSGLKRPVAKPDANNSQTVVHPMPFDDSYLGGMNSWSPIVNAKTKERFNKIRAQCKKMRLVTDRYNERNRPKLFFSKAELAVTLKNAETTKLTSVLKRNSLTSPKPKSVRLSLLTDKESGGVQLPPAIVPVRTAGLAKSASMDDFLNDLGPTKREPRTRFHDMEKHHAQAMTKSASSSSMLLKSSFH